MIPLSRKAEIAYHALQQADMEKVQKSIEMLNMYPQKTPSADRVKKLADSEDLFIMEATPEIGIIFQMTGSDKEITEIVRYERLKKMFGHRGTQKR
ncbi:MAG: hypothetical protein GY749_17075 [Desulfobacteraceae bacterium]|nr:hypothetical protein [Desulfobacteraceae bacterium]